VKTATRGAATLARLFGVELSYEGMDGTERRADPEALLATLRALGAQLDDGVSNALAARRAELEALAIQPVHVAWEGSLRELRVRLPHADAERASIEIRLEQGDVITHDCRAEPIAARRTAGWQPSHRLRIGRRLPLGYHRISVETAGATFESFIIAAPRHAHAPADARSWGVFLPLYALHGAGAWGVGDYTGLRAIAEWTRQQGGDFVGTLPLLAAFLDAPFEPSPYAPASRLFWNELFVDVTRVPGWTPAPDTREEIAAAAAGEHVDYRRAATLRRRELERALHDGGADALAAVEQFAQSLPRVDDYATFRAVCDRRREGWPVWPERLRSGEIREGDYAPEDRAYHLFAQMHAEQQLSDVANAAKAAALYLDMPLGVHVDSYDAWRFRDLFAEGVSAGAPPDPLFTGGQDWGFRPLNPRALRASGYGYLIETLRNHFRHAKLLRLDHVMSLYRLFWIPHGLAATRGVYVRYPEDELFAVLLLESARHNAVVIGEDLGTVPAAVRAAMDRHSVHRMHVVQFEANPDAQPPVPDPDEPVVASLNTHDMPTFAGFWRGSEIDDQLDLALIDAAAHEHAMERRAELRRRLSRSVGGGGAVDVAVVRQRLLERLAASPARYLIVNLEDLWLEDRPQNVPGTSDERPNWKRRMRRSLDDIIHDAAIRRMLRGIDERRIAARADAERDG